MPIYPGRRKGSWRVTVWKHGRQHEEIVEGARSEAREHEARMRVALAARPRGKRRLAPTFFDLSAVEYTPHAKAHLGANTWKRSRKYQLANLVDFLGGYRLTELSTSIVEAYAVSRLEARATPTTVNNELRVLRTILRWAAEDLGHPVAALRVRLLSAVRRRVHVWTPSQVRTLLKACRRLDGALVPMVVFAINTGCRKGEIVAAPWAWLDERARVLRLGAVGDWAPKSKRPREIPVSDALWAELKSLPRLSEWMFPSALGTRFREWPDKRFAAVVASAGLKGGPHTARHTYASFFLAAGGTLWQLAGILGHSSQRTTELYAHLLPGHFEAARNVVNIDAMGRNPGGTLAGRAAIARKQRPA